MTELALPLTPESLAASLGIAEDRLERLKKYQALLQKWQPKINLVGPSTLADPWRRHFLDSAQIVAHIPKGADCLIDLGSGAGFPGLVLAILTDVQVTLIESDQRKGAFLRAVARETETKVTVLSSRIERANIEPAAVITARALAPVVKLCEYTAPLLAPGGTAVFLKGRQVSEELTQAREHWKMDVTEQGSLSDPSGVILNIRNLKRGPA